MSLVLDNQSTRDPVIVNLGLTSPSLFDQIFYNGELVDFSGGGTVNFFMRPLQSRNPTTDAAANPLSPPTSDGMNVSYDWASGDVSLEGQYMGWWGYELPGLQLQETPEFQIIITDHGPGFGTQTGAVVDGASQYMPTTVARLREDPDFGDRFLQKHADWIKQIVLGVVVAPDQEIAYNQFLVDYLSARLAERLIVPAKEYWGRQYRQVLTNGPSESASYPDMLANLDDLCHRLGRELPMMWRQLQFIVPGLPQLRAEPMPLSSLGDPATNIWSNPVTRSPQETAPARTGGPRFNPWFQF